MRTNEIMNPSRPGEIDHPTRRGFLTSAASGLGSAALASLLREDGVASEAESLYAG